MLREYIEQDFTTNKVFEDLTKIVDLKATIIDLEINLNHLSRQKQTFDSFRADSVAQFAELEEKIKEHDQLLSLTQEGQESQGEGLSKAIDEANQKILHIQSVATKRNDEI
jgi:hypothetical protein